MPGFAGSSAYFLRYMDPYNDEALVAKDKNEYWRSVDSLHGGKEHVLPVIFYIHVFRICFLRFGYVCEAELFKSWINQGMIQGQLAFVYREGTNKFVSHGLAKTEDVTPIQGM